MQSQISALAKRIGVTRVANLTGLDRLAVPVMAAIRPLSRNLTVSFGKGLTMEQAECSAVMEAAELFYSESPCTDLLAATYDDLPAHTALDPSLLRRHKTSHGLGSERFAWIEGQDLLSGEPILTPWQAISMDFTENARRNPSKVKTGATGLAAGFDETQAIVHGIYEVIERNCHNTWNDLDDAARIATLIDHNCLKDDTLRPLLHTIASADLHVLVWEMSDHRKIPCFLVELVDLKPHASTAYVQGTAASLSGVEALRKALLEAMQIRLTYIAGSRDDLDWSDYGTRYDAVVESRKWLIEKPISRKRLHPENVRYNEAHIELAEVKLRMTSAGHQKIIAVRLSPPEEDVSVVKIMIPNLSDIPDADHYASMRRNRKLEYA